MLRLLAKAFFRGGLGAVKGVLQILLVLISLGAYKTKN
jgi:hypothetical protein